MQEDSNAVFYIRNSFDLRVEDSVRVNFNSHFLHNHFGKSNFISKLNCYYFLLKKTIGCKPSLSPSTWLSPFSTLLESADRLNQLTAGLHPSSHLLGVIPLVLLLNRSQDELQQNHEAVVLFRSFMQLQLG